MSKYLIILLVLICVQAQSQISLELNTGYLYYFTGNNTVNDFNYGFSLLVMDRIAKLKVATGVEYSTMFYHYDVSPENSNDYLTRRNYKLQYLNFPLLIILGNRLTNNLNIHPLGGLVFNKNINYSLISNYSDDPNEQILDLKSADDIGISLRCGASVSKKAGNRLTINFLPLADFKIKSNSSNQFRENDFRTIPNSFLSISIKIGLEYNFY